MIETIVNCKEITSRVILAKDVDQTGKNIFAVKLYDRFNYSTTVHIRLVKSNLSDRMFGQVQYYTSYPDSAIALKKSGNDRVKTDWVDVRREIVGTKFRIYLDQCNYYGSDNYLREFEVAMLCEGELHKEYKCDYVSFHDIK